MHKLKSGGPEAGQTGVRRRGSRVGGPGPAVMGTSTLLGDDVYNHKGKYLGHIREIMVTMDSGRVAYAVLSFGGFLGMNKKLFAVPWDALTVDPENACFVLNVDQDRLLDAPGFDQSSWPNMADQAWEWEIHAYYGTRRDDSSERVGTAAEPRTPQVA
jgi:sporulation protein YlmC with PRC-barrel domain